MSVNTIFFSSVDRSAPRSHTNSPRATSGSPESSPYRPLYPLRCQNRLPNRDPGCSTDIRRLFCNLTGRSNDERAVLLQGLAHALRRKDIDVAFEPATTAGSCARLEVPVGQRKERLRGTGADEKQQRQSAQLRMTASRFIWPLFRFLSPQRT